MNVSISTVVKDLDTSITAMQAAITFYTLTMASLMLLGGKLGDIWGRKRAFTIGSSVYALGSLITAISPNITVLFIGWSVVEGIGAVLVVPAIAALAAVNYTGKDRIKAYALISGVAGAAAAAGPLIGGFVTTYLSWRYVFIAEVFIMIGVLLTTKNIKDEARSSKKSIKIDVPSVLLSSVGLIMIVFGMLQSKTWGWIDPRSIPTINGAEIAPLGISIVAYLILAGIILLRIFYTRQQKLEQTNNNPLLSVSMLGIPRLRSGLNVLLAQYLVIGAVFFIIPVYLQTTLGYDALKTGLKILPLSISLVIFSVLGAKFSSKYSPKKIIRIGQILIIAGVIFTMGAIDTYINSFAFICGMFLLGGGFGLLASQIGNVNMSSVSQSKSSEVGGLQGVFQNLGSSLGTALIGSALVGALSTGFNANIQASTLPNGVKQYVSQNSTAGVAIVPAGEVNDYAISVGLSEDQAQEATDAYAASEIQAIKQALFLLMGVAVLTLLFSKNIPDEVTL